MRKSGKTHILHHVDLFYIGVNSMILCRLKYYSIYAYWPLKLLSANGLFQNLYPLQIPEGLFNFKQKDKDLVVLFEGVGVQDDAEGPVHTVLDGEAVNQIT